jgi:uncharacterized protein (DUF302 family)
MAEVSHLAGSVTEPYSRKDEFVHRTKKSGGTVITADIARAEHTMTRLDIATRMPFDEFRAAFEQAAPAFDPAPVQLITEAGGSWDDVRAAVAVNAPNQLMVYARIDATELFAVAGHRTKAVEYLLGNHVIAESMFRYDAHALLYAPLRVLVYADADDNAVFTMDQPSGAFGSVGIAEVTDVGRGLDDKVSALLRVIGVDAVAAFAH